MNKALVFLTIIAFAACNQHHHSEVISSEDNAARVLAHEISNIENEVRSEQNAHTALWNQQMSECVSEFEFRTAEIEAGNVAQVAAEAASLRCSTALATAEADLAKAEGYVATIDGILQGLAVQRALENAAWRDLVDNQLQPALEAVQGVYPILDSFTYAEVPDFVQLSNHVTKMFSKVVAAKQTSKFSLIVSAFLQTKDWEHGVSQDVIATLEQLFNELEADLNDAIDAANDAEAAAVEVYTQTVAEYEAIKATLIAKIIALNNYISELQACVSNENSIAAEAAAKVARNTQALNNAIDMCNAFDTEYSNASAARDEELVLLAKIKCFIREQKRIFGKYGNDGVDAFEQYQATLEIEKKITRKSFITAKIAQVKAFKKSGAAEKKCESCKNSFLQKKL